MVLPFALVEWKGDPKPDCWQVIKTSAIQANPGDICEGKCVDALWKRDEDTSVAEILKLSGECELQSLQQIVHVAGFPYACVLKMLKFVKS